MHIIGNLTARAQCVYPVPEIYISSCQDNLSVIKGGEFLLGYDVKIFSG